MSHSMQHPDAEKSFRVKLKGSDQAIYDKTLQGQTIRLIDWADRLDQYKNFSNRQIKASLTFFAHRCLPDLDLKEELALGLIETTNLIAVVRSLVHNSEPFEDLVILYENELVELDAI